MKFSVVALAILFWAAPAAADVSEQLALARICASETSIRISADCPAIHLVIANRAAQAHMSYVAMAHMYSSRVFDEQRTDARAWLAHLQPSGAEPLHWPRYTWRRRGDVLVRRPHAPWRNYRDRWLALYRYAGRIVRGEVTAECSTVVEPGWGFAWGSTELEPDDWGGDMDTARYRRGFPGALQLVCGDTSNTFWVRSGDRVRRRQFDRMIATLADGMHRAP